MSKTDCLDADWYQQGYEVGSAGEPEISKAFNKREKRCAKYGAAADWVAFENGYSEGVDQYCEVSNALKLGVRGISRSIETCPESEYFGFYRAFNAGYKLFQLNEQAREAGYQLDRLQNSIYNKQREAQNIRYRLNSGELTKDEQSYAAERYRRLRRQINYLRYDSRKFETRLYDSQRAADKYQRYLETEFESASD